MRKTEGGIVYDIKQLRYEPTGAETTTLVDSTIDPESKGKEIIICGFIYDCETAGAVDFSNGTDSAGLPGWANVKNIQLESTDIKFPRNAPAELIHGAADNKVIWVQYRLE